MIHCSDQFALPRCPATSLRLPIGQWEYRTVAEPALWVARGWRVVGPSSTGGYVVKYTYQERA